MKIKNSQNHLLILFLIISLISILLIVSHSSVVRAKTDDSVQAIYLADEISSMDFSETLSSLSQSTLDSGKIWSDKSVFPKSGKTTKIEIDREQLEFEDDFLEVLSVIGSTSEIAYPVSRPRDYVLLLDLSSSMALLNQENYRIHKAVTAINTMANEILKSNPENRVGIVCFGLLARVLVEIDHYTEFNLSDTVQVFGISKNITINFSAKTSEGQIISKQITNTKKGVYQYTNIRDAFTLGFSQFIENSSANDPYLILISNGNSTAINTQPLFEDTIVEEDSFENSMLYGIEGVTMAEDVSVFVTLLSGAYQKSRTEKTLQKTVRVFALGFDVEDEERESLKQYLDPKHFFAEAPDNIILTWWNKWMSEDNSLTLPLKESNSHSDSYSLEEDLPENYTIPKFVEKNGVLKSDIISNFNYIDQYYEISFDHIENILGEFIEKKSIPAFHPISTNAPNDLGDTGALTFYDPIGEGIQISQFKGVSLFGKFYPVVEKEESADSSNIREFFIVDLEPKEQYIINSAYSDNPSFTLDQIKIQVLSEEPDKEILKITFPEAALPVFKVSLTLSQLPDISGHRQVMSYELLDKENFSKPIRFFYTLRKIEDFRPSTEYQSYLTNLYSSNNIHGLSNGDTYLTFTPSPENPYYFVPENEEIYKTKIEKGKNLQFSQVEATEPILSDVTYYIKKSFYSFSTGKSEVMYPLINQTNSVTQSEALNRKSLYQHHPEDIKLKKNIATNSAETVLYPQADPISHSVKHFLGNNGKLIQNFIPVSEKEPNLILRKYQRVNDKEFTKKNIEVSAGDRITYLLILENIGNKQAEKIKVWDIIPDGLEYIYGSASTNGTVQNKKITWEIPLLKPGEKVTLNFKVSTPRKDTTTSWENSALFQEKRQLNPDYSNKVVSIIKPSKLTVEKLQSVNGDTVTKSLESIRTGDTLTYFLTVYNAGPGRATNVTVSDTVPSGLTLLKESITNSGIITNNEIKWNIDQINPYERINLSFSVIIANSPITKFYNMAFLREENLDKTYFSNTVLAVKNDDVMESLSVNNIMIEKKQSVNNGIFTKDVLSIQNSDSVTYLITILNESDSELRNVQINDKLPLGLDLDFTSISSGGFFLEDSIVWTINHIPPRGKRNLEYKMQLGSDSDYTYYKNSARLTHSQSISPIESNEVTLRRLMPNLNLTKSQSVNSASATQDPVEVKPLDKVTYYLTVENSSPTMNLKAVKIVDPVDPNLIVHTASISGNGVYEDGSVIWYISSLEPEEVKILYFTVSIPSKKVSSLWSNYAKAFIGHSLITDSNTVIANESSLQPLNLSSIENRPNIKPAFLIEPTKPKAAPETGTKNFVKITLLILFLGSISLLILQRERLQIFRILKRK